jgi:hypothetical protein
MTKDELDSLRQYAAMLAERSAVEATVSYDESDGGITVTAITHAGSGEPRTVTRSAKFKNREQAEALVEDVIHTAASH